MATAGRVSRRQTGSNDDLVELPPASVRLKRPARRKPAAEDLAADVLTPEEEYLLKVLRRCSSSKSTTTATAASPAASNNQKLLQQPSTSRRSPSPPVPKASPPLSKGTPVATAAAAGSGDGKPGIAAATVPQAEEKPGLAPTDAVSRAKMILEKKRKAAARFGSGASSGAAGVLRKAKITKATGTPSSNPRLDPIKARGALRAYPASGLLLRDEYRTFAEIEKEGERVYEPLDPLVRLLKNFGIADSNSGADGVVKKQFHETLVMRATIPAHSTSWAINICPKDHKDFEEILFHFNPRRRFVAMNNREGNIWGQQEKHMLSTRWPEVFNVSINVAVQIDAAGFHVAVDGKYCATFAHRTKVPPTGEELVLQVMTRDDYDTNLRLVVHEVWWGHKDTMPGLPGRDKEPNRRTAENWRGSNSNDAFVDLHAAGLPPMPNLDLEESVRKRLVDMFQPYGAIQVRVFHRESKNFGFIKFREHNDAAKALEELGGAEVHGKPMRLSKAAAR
ncbi:unnamed protein product [Ectocarpus sp. 4 AP-2014]